MRTAKITPTVSGVFEIQNLTRYTRTTNGITAVGVLATAYGPNGAQATLYVDDSTRIGDLLSVELTQIT
jgi:hypothetical protein